MANAQNGFFTSKIPCKFMIGIGYPRRTLPGAGDDSPLVGGRFSAHFIHDTVDVFSDETRNARKLVNQSLGKCKSAFYISF